MEEIFTKLLGRYNASNELTQKLWSEVAEQYSGKKKYYHNLTHLENVWLELNEVKQDIKEWDTILFALFYHDIIYSATRTDNEEQSAVLAEKRMLQLGLPQKMIADCKLQILATQKHLPSENSDINFLTDADLSILGKSWDLYSAYAANVRKEYSFYPDMVYNAGRRKALKHFLGLERIFKSDYFYQKYESQAKLNLFSELRTL